MKPTSSPAVFPGLGSRPNPLFAWGLPHWVNRRMQGLGIRQKIGLGYGIAVGVIVCGTVLGLAVGDYYQGQALQRRKVASHHKTLLNQLNLVVLETRSHQQQLIPLLNNPKAFNQERQRLQDRIGNVDTLLAQLRAEATDSAHANDRIVQQLSSVLRTYDGTVEVYWRNLETILDRFNPAFLKPAMLGEAQSRLLEFNNNQATQQFDQLTQQLSQLAELSQAEELQAELALEQASILRQQVVALSVLLAILLAVLWGMYLSRELAQPLEAAHKTAQQVIAETNFSLQVPITTRDEVGKLAHSLNQLIQWVDRYTHELKQAQQTLEQRVAERTEELLQKNQQLEKTHTSLSNTLEHLKQTQTQLVQAEKMSGLGQLVAGVAHEINNPVNFIYGNLTYAEDYMQSLLRLIQSYRQASPQVESALTADLADLDLEFVIADFPKILGSMRIGAERIQKIVASLRTFSRMDEADMKTVDLHEGLDSTLMILQNRFKGRAGHPPIQILKEYGVLPAVECYAGQLNQVFMNIVVNALDALEERDSNLAATDLEQHSSQIRIRTAPVGSNQVAIWIADNGPGMPESVRQRLFDPFFTTKAVGKGTGLGLSISYQIVTEKHGGQISCTSTPGQGTEFLIQVPLQQTPSRQP